MSDRAKFLAFEKRTATIDGVTKTWAEWCEHYGITRRAAYGRMYYYSRPFEQAVRGKMKKKKSWRNIPRTIDGVTKTPEEWLKDAGITINGYYARLNRGMTVDEALTVRHLRKYPDKTVKVSGRVDMSDVKGIDLNKHPTQEVIEMCEKCPYDDCVSVSAWACLRKKRRKEMAAMSNG